MYSKWQVQLYDRLSIKQPFSHFCMYIVNVSSAPLCRTQGIAGNTICKHVKHSPSSINLKFGSILSAGVFNNETAAKFTQDIVHLSLHTLIFMYMNSSCVQVWHTCRNTCFVCRKNRLDTQLPRRHLFGVFTIKRPGSRYARVLRFLYREDTDKCTLAITYSDHE